MKLIESDTWRLWTNPAEGVSWLAAEVQRNALWHAVVPECRPSAGQRPGQNERAPLGAANFHMVPYSNRVRAGKFNFRGQSIELLEAQKHAIHGALRKLPWTVISEDSSHLVCEIDSSDFPRLNWPWPIHCRLEQRIEGDRLSSCLQLTNRGNTPMPAGLGWHPYFVRTVNGAEPTLTLPVTGVFPDEQGDCLPDGAAVALPAELNFQTARRLDAAQRIDCCLSGLSGPCEIDWREGGIKLQLSASENCQYLVLYNPDMPHFAVEPVTNANDAFNLTDQGIESGMQVLAPGESLQATMTVVATIS